MMANETFLNQEETVGEREQLIWRNAFLNGKILQLKEIFPTQHKDSIEFNFTREECLDEREVLVWDSAVRQGRIAAIMAVAIET
jgi:hypothetical protein